MLVLQAWRSWGNAKTVALLAAAALGIGIGSATSIYTVVNAVMLKPLPYRAGNRFVAGSRFQVVGIVGDVRNDGLSSPPVPEIYITSAVAEVETMNFVVRSARPAATLVPEIRRVVQRIDPEQPIHQVASMREIIQRSMTLERVASLLMAFFSGAALLMAMLGIYGMVSYAVRQRTVEIGTRMALGATRREVLSLIVWGGLKMATYGAIAGGIAAIGAAFYVSRVFKIGEPGLVPFLYSTSSVGLVALVASFVPAWRAAFLTPMVAIRNEPASM